MSTRVPANFNAGCLGTQLHCQRAGLERALGPSQASEPFTAASTALAPGTSPL